MGRKDRPKMPVEQRAKQFAPFAALTGFEKEVEDKINSLLMEEHRFIDEEREKRINGILSSAVKGDTVFLEYYDDGIYRKISGEIREISPEQGFLKTDKLKIRFEDIYDISLTGGGAL